MTTTEGQVWPFPIWPNPMPDERMAMLKQAKAALGLDFRIQPVVAEPGMSGRVFCWAGEIPPFICEAVIIRPENADSAESWLNALRFMLTAPEGAVGAFGWDQWLAAHLPGAREITDPVELSLLDDLAERRRWKAAGVAA